MTRAKYRRADQDNNIASQGRGDGWAIPIPGKRSEQMWFEEAVLPAAGVYATTFPVDIWKTREVHLYCRYQAAAAGGILSIVPEVNPGASYDNPANESNLWLPVGVVEGVVSSTDLGVNPGGSLYTKSNMGSVTIRPMEIRTEAADALTDIIGFVATVTVVSGKYLRLKVAEAGAVGTPGTLEVRYTKSV